MSVDYHVLYCVENSYDKFKYTLFYKKPVYKKLSTVINIGEETFSTRPKMIRNPQVSKIFRIRNIASRNELLLHVKCLFLRKIAGANVNCIASSIFQI